MDKLITVIVLTYNNFSFLQNAINSILIQDYSNIEVIVSDDGSDRFDYNEVNSMFINKGKNIRMVNITSNNLNLGTVKNFNNAIKKSNGKIIIPLSCDDEFSDKRVISRIVDFFENNDCLICTGKMSVINQMGIKKTIKPNKNDIGIFVRSNKKVLKKMCQKNRISGACVYYRRDVFDKYGYFDEKFRLLEDHPYYIDYLYRGGKIGVLDYVTLKYREGGVSTVKKINPFLLEDFKNVYKYKIFKYKDRIGVLTYRECKLDYYRKFCYDKNFKSILFQLKFLDVIFIKVIRKVKEGILNV